MPSSDIEAFFRGYVEAFNRSLGETVDADGIRAHFTDCFVGAGPAGVNCGKNDDGFTETLEKGYAFYKSIGAKRMMLREVQVTPIDEHHQMAKVFYRADYEKKDNEAVSIDFDVTYLVQMKEVPRIFAFIAGDEMALYRKYGLLPDEEAPAGQTRRP